eukprot:3743145-Pleurochrysis_carterae.AAC.2
MAAYVIRLNPFILAVVPCRHQGRSQLGAFQDTEKSGQLFSASGLFAPFCSFPAALCVRRSFSK